MCSFSRHLGFDQGLITKHHNPKVGHVMLRYMPTAERSAPEEKECNFTHLLQNSQTALYCHCNPQGLSRAKEV